MIKFNGSDFHRLSLSISHINVESPLRSMLEAQTMNLYQTVPFKNE